MTIKERTQEELKSLSKTELRAIKTEIYTEIKGKLMPEGVMPILNAVKKELTIRRGVFFKHNSKKKVTRH